MFKWTEDLATGVELIDQQHQEMFTKANTIFSSNTPTTIMEHFDFFVDYVIEHFSLEERYMIHSRYPHFVEHREQHTYFMIEIYKLHQLLHSNAPTASTLTVFKALLVDWLIDHIHGQDKHFSQHYQNGQS
jgi:hemerythrin